MDNFMIFHIFLNEHDKVKNYGYVIFFWSYREFNFKIKREPTKLNLALHSPLAILIIRFSEQTKIKKPDILFSMCIFVGKQGLNSPFIISMKLLRKLSKCKLKTSNRKFFNDSGCLKITSNEIVKKWHSRHAPMTKYGFTSIFV